MKVRSSVRRICENCRIIRRKGVVRVICTNPRHQSAQCNEDDTEQAYLPERCLDIFQ